MAVSDAPTHLPPPRPRALSLDKDQIPGKTDEQRGLRYSLAFHLIVFILIMLRTVVFPGKPLTYTPTLRVDLVGLPDQLKKDQRTPKSPPVDKITEALKKAEQDAKSIEKQAPPKPPPPVPKLAEKLPEAADPDELVLKPKVQPPADLHKRLFSSLDRIRSLDRIQNELSKSDGKDAKDASEPIKGNIMSKGSSTSGEAKESDQASYFDLVRDKLQDNWALPIWLQRQGYTAKVIIFIDANGRVRDCVFAHSSGNQQFDDAVKHTIQTSQPFDPPPDDIAGQTQSRGIPFAFPL